MFQINRAFMTPGIALLGAGALALGPLQEPLVSEATYGHPSNHAYSLELAAAVNPITRVLELWNTSEENASHLSEEFFKAPMPALQQVVANQLNYFANLGSIDILGSMINNAKEALATPFAPATGQHDGSLNNVHWGLYNLIYTELPDSTKKLVDLSTSWATGLLLGLVGPFVAPVLAFGDSLAAIFTSVFEEQDFGAAIAELINIPANVIGGFLNGQRTLELTPLLKALNVLPSEINSVGITMGGILSHGGSLFNSLSISGDLFGDIPGQGAGFIGSVIGLSQAVARAIGWDGVGNPLNPSIPVPGGAASVPAPAATVEVDLSAPVDTRPSGSTEQDASTESTSTGRGSLGKSSRIPGGSASRTGEEASNDKAGSSHGRSAGPKRAKAHDAA